MDKGTLVECRVHGDRHLAVVDHPEGKKNWVVTDERGQSYTLHPRQVSYQVEGQTYKPNDISGFLKRVQPYLDPSSLEVAWELLVEESEAVDPAALAGLLFSEQTPEACYAAHCLLSEDKLFFKQKGDRYEPRSQAQVAELKHQLEMEAQRLSERQSFLDRVYRALANEDVEWQDSDRPRIHALERFATLGEDATHRSPAIETLVDLDRDQTAQAAFQLLVDLKLWG
ncbi:MAG TPA: RNB domain-containing ribonuclease, partial [Elainellaceae cyanobacterium]